MHAIQRITTANCEFVICLSSTSFISNLILFSFLSTHTRCVFTEFPGCFACETDADGYQFFVHFHYLCSTIAFILSSFLLGKILIAFPVVRDELANPTTAAPLGLLFMAFMKVFAGNFGSVGEGITFVAAGLHTIVAAW